MLKNYINGETSIGTSDRVIEDVNPCTEEIIYEFKSSSKNDVDAAVMAAKTAFKSWRNLSRIQRATYFEKLQKELESDVNGYAHIISTETGKTLNESRAEIIESIHMVQYAIGRARTSVGDVLGSEIPDKDLYVLKRPKGVIGIICPWNFPFGVSFWCIVPSILEGNTVVFKPSEETPWCGYKIAKLFEAAGFPPGVLNMVQGDSYTGDSLVHSEVNHICFTGSLSVGMSIRKACADYYNKTCSCEMGSKSAVMVFNDADLDLAVNACVASAYKLSGQRCVSSGRMLIQWDIFYEFAKKFVEKSQQVKVDDPSNGDMGPLISLNQMNRVIQYNKMTEIDDVQILLKGEKRHNKGYYLSPHVYTTPWNNNYRFLSDEVFGPHVALIPFNDVDEAVSIYNDTKYGLSCSVCTNNYKIMRYIRDNCEFGLGYVNLPTIGSESHAIFNGVKGSGYGGASAAGTFDTVVDKFTWTVNHSGPDFKMAQGLK